MQRSSIKAWTIQCRTHTTTHMCKNAGEWVHKWSQVNSFVLFVVAFAIKYLGIRCNLWWASAETTNTRQNSRLNCQKTHRRCGEGNKWSARCAGSHSVACQTVCLVVWWHWLIRIPDFGAFYSSSVYINKCVWMCLPVGILYFQVVTSLLHTYQAHMRVAISEKT